MIDLQQVEDQRDTGNDQHKDDEDCLFSGPMATEEQKEVVINKSHQCIIGNVTLKEEEGRKSSVIIGFLIVLILSNGQKAAVGTLGNNHF